MERDAVSSLLLRIPEEIRRMIWSEVFGHSIHIESESRPILYFRGSSNDRISQSSPVKHRLHTHRCLAAHSDAQVYLDSQNFDDDLKVNGVPRYDMPSQDLGYNHRDCYQRTTDARTRCLNLDLLRVCRQMHIEASTTLYITTTFCFRNVNAFLEFCSSITPAQKGMLRKINVHLTETLENLGRWHFSEDEPLPDLPGLRSLHMSIDMQFPEPLLFECFKDLTASDGDNMEYLESTLLTIQNYQLDTATVVVSDYLYVPTMRAKFQDPAQFDEVQSRHRWTLKEKRDLAECIRLRFLSPDGAEVVRRSRAKRRCAVRRMSRRLSKHLGNLANQLDTVTAKRSKRIGEAVN